MTFPRSEWLYRILFLVAESDRSAADAMFAEVQGMTVTDIGSSFIETIPASTYDENFNLVPPANPEWRYVFASITEAIRLAWLNQMAQQNITVKMYRFINPHLSTEQKTEIIFTLLGLSQQAAEALADTGTDLILIDTNVEDSPMLPGDRLTAESEAIADFLSTLD